MYDRLKQLQEQKTQCDIRNKNQRIAMSNLKNKYENLNKGIDELIKKYEDELENIHRQWGDDVFHYHTYEKDLYKEIIQDLKKLKGE